MTNNTYQYFQINAGNVRDVAVLCNQVHFTIRDNQCAAVSFCDSVVMITRDTIRLDIYYYGAHDVDVVTSHVCAFLRHSQASLRRCRTSYVLVHFPLAMDADQVDERLSPALGARFVGGSDFATTGTVASETRQPLTPLSKL